MNEHQIRGFTVEDRELVQAFFDQMGGETRGFFNRNEGNRKNAMNFFEKDGVEPSTVRYLSSVRDANGNERMTGYVFAWDMDTSMPILGIAVADDCKGQGLGKVLIRHLIDHLKSNGYGGVMLTTSFANVRGQGLYERMGFKHFGTSLGSEMLYILRFER